MTATEDHQKNFSRRIKAFGCPGWGVNSAQSGGPKNAGHYKHFSPCRVTGQVARQTVWPLRASIDAGLQLTVREQRCLDASARMPVHCWGWKLPPIPFDSSSFTGAVDAQQWLPGRKSLSSRSLMANGREARAQW
ncbi:hypothetical protein D3C71_1700250 [compost metagenome]